MKDKHTPGPWHKHDPNKEGSYICRMKNGYIKMCYWGTTKWTDIWQTTLDGEVKEWMTIPGDELPVDPNARLMAESPELYRKLKKAIKYIGLAACNSDKEFQEKMEFLADVMVSIKRIESDECNHLP